MPIEKCQRCLTNTLFAPRQELTVLPLLVLSSAPRGAHSSSSSAAAASNVCISISSWFAFFASGLMSNFLTAAMLPTIWSEVSMRKRKALVRIAYTAGSHLKLIVVVLAASVSFVYWQFQ